MATMSRWLIDWGHAHPEPAQHAGQARPSDADEHVTEPADPTDPTSQQPTASPLPDLAEAFETRAQDLQRAALQRDASALLEALGTTSRACVQCHERTRDKPSPGLATAMRVPMVHPLDGR